MIARMSTQPINPGTARAEFTRVLAAACNGIGLLLSASQVDLLWRHFELLLQTNRQINLTRITAPADAAVKHYADSLAVVPWARKVVPPGARVLDVGTGAGFPAVPLAVCCPDWHIVAVDGTRKKADFLATTAAELGLGNLTVKHARARKLAGQVEPFHLIACRAVGDLLSNAKETKRLVAVGGWLVCYTTPRALRNVTPSQARQIIRLGFGPLKSETYHLPLGHDVIEHALAMWQRR
jgi:16S rRNA (guanine527-N7)-methyltransferase